METSSKESMERKSEVELGLRLEERVKKGMCVLVYLYEKGWLPLTK